MSIMPLGRERNKSKKHPIGKYTQPKPSRFDDDLRPSYVGGEAKLLGRVKQYLRGCQNRRSVNIEYMADELQKTHREYRRKRRHAFKLAVMKGTEESEKAYDIVCEEGAVEAVQPAPVVKDKGSASSDNESSGHGAADSDSSRDDHNYVVVEDTNAVNNSLQNLYSRKSVSFAGQDTTIPVPKVRHPSSSLLETQQSPSISSNIRQDEDIRILENKEPAANQPREKESTGANVSKRASLSSPGRKKKKEIIPVQSTVTFANIGGNERCLEEVCKLLMHLKHPEVFQQLGVQPPRGLLLHGPPGCGKTLLAHAIAGELEMPFIKIAATEIVSGVSGESEEKVRELFSQAIASAPCVLFIDEIDSITPKRETAQREMERRIVAQLLTCMDDLNQKDFAAQVLVIGATNRPDAVDPALRRAGRFDREICIGIPDTAARGRILQVLCRDLRLALNFDFSSLARSTPGYVGADLMALVREAAMIAINRVFQALRSTAESRSLNRQISIGLGKKPDESNAQLELLLSWLKEQPPLTVDQLQNLYLEMQDFEEALKVVQPSAKREGFITVPDVSWSDVGALRGVREELQMAILAPINHPDHFKALGLSQPSGILLCGPPGCGKTLLAKAIANESRINFISVRGPELLNMYLGESERAVRQCFIRARNSAPCVIFFDELDALCPKRTDSSEGGASSRVVNQLLTEMDGMESRRNVFILGATNRPDIIDPAVLRPGRLDRTLYVGLPLPSDRVDILNAVTKNGTHPPLESITMSEIGCDLRCSRFSGADLACLVREASLAALKEAISSRQPMPGEVRVARRHFEIAFTKVHPSVSPKDLRMYERMKHSFLLGAVKSLNEMDDPTVEPMQTDK